MNEYEQLLCDTLRNLDKLSQIAPDNDTREICEHAADDLRYWNKTVSQLPLFPTQDNQLEL